MDIDKAYNNDEQEWQWCLVGNIVEEHEYGEEHIIKSGTKHFRPNAKVYINMVYGGRGHENILVIGMPRHLEKYIEIVIARKYVSNFRMQKVYKPAVLNRMKNSEWDWWGDTEESRNNIMGFLEWLNPEEAAKEKNKLLYSGMKGKILRSIEQKISEWQEDDIYAISLYVFNEEDDPCRPVVVLGYNTERQVQKSTPEASDEQEARWNYAFWLQNEEMCWGRGDTAEDIKEWITEQGLLEREDEITEKFVDLLVAVVQDIHASGLLKDKFGREIPILIHELEYYEKIARQNIEANGEALDRDFISFCMPYIPEVQDEMHASQNEVPKAEKRITTLQSQRIQGSSVIGKKSADMRIVIAFIVIAALIMLSFWVLGLIISSRNTSVSEDLPQQTVDFGEENEESISQPEEKEHPEQTTFDAVPYFDEDTNGMLQYADGWLYGYLGGNIFRIDVGTGELSVLFETAGSRSMHFCIDDGFLYFLTIPQVTFVDGVKADLYRMNCDSSGFVLLAEGLSILDKDISDGNETLKMSVYEDVLYIMFNRKAVCLQLLDDGSVKEMPCEDTLYGLLLDGYFAPDSYDIFPSIPYCAEHYGYFFAVNSEGRLLRVDAESGLWESMPGQIDHRQGFVTHEGVYLADREERKWIRYSLEDVTRSSDWRKYDPGFSSYTEMIGWEENGAFLIQREGIESPVQLVFVDWEGKETPLVSFQQQILYALPYGMEKYYIRDGWLYYRDEWDGEAWLMRISCEGGEPENLYCYYVRPDKGLAESETVEKNRENTDELRISTSITKLWLKENEEGAAKINAALREIYKEAEAEMEAFNQKLLDEYLFEDGVLREDLDEWLYGYPLDEWLAASTEDYAAFIEYVDENYLCLCMIGDYYVAGGAHGYYWDDYYVFDRHTGKRLTLEDFVSNSPEEIKEIVKNHILAAAPYSDGEQSEDALEPDRFFLTAEGLGIHYDVYEIGSYVDGPCDLIIPFELFDMKEDMRPGSLVR